MKLTLMQLDPLRAVFANAAEQVELTITRKTWQDHGKPTTVNITIEGSHE